MIKTIIFDFGNVFINLDIETSIQKAFDTFEIKELPKDLLDINIKYEIGQISTDEFVRFYAEKFPNISKKDLIDLWNMLLKDFPKHRLEFLKDLKANHDYKLILLSNTNELHIDWIKEQVSFYNEFKNCFDAFYLSHDIHLRKPNHDIFEFVLDQHALNPKECLFIDDNADNIKTANTLNINTWHITPYKEDVATLFSTKKDLF